MSQTKQQITQLLNNFRDACEQAWCEATASPNLRPISGKPLSTGQCSATSLLLRDELQKQLSSDSIKLVLGAVYNPRTMQPLIPLHVWLQYYEKDQFDEPLIIDITGDQSPTICQRVIFDTPANLAQQGILYLPSNFLDELRPQTAERAVLLKQLLT